MSGRARILVLVSGGTVLLDQVTKLYITRHMHVHQSITIIPDFFNLTYVRNPGAAFGILATSSNAFRLVFFALTSLFALALLGLIFFRMSHDDWKGQISVAAVLGGAIGNLLDRLRLGEVIDFLDFYVKGFHWPAFNVADAAISLGVLALIIHFAFEKKEPHPAPHDSPDHPS